MNPDYDYSIFTNLKIVDIVNRYTDRDQPFTFSIPSFASRYHQNIASTTLRPNFLYNQQDPNDVVYQEWALYHHQKYPVEKQYTLVKDAFRLLHQMFKINGKKLGESSLYLATVRYLALLYQQLYGNETAESLSKSQFAIILPIFLEKDGKFIKDILRPLFMEAGWISESDFRSKLVIFGKVEARLYARQQEQLTIMNFEGGFPKIEREKRYMCCLIQRDMHDDSLVLTLDIIQMRFDKDFVAASKSSISSSKAHILTPQFMVPSKTILIQDWVSAKTLQLPRFLLSRIFAGSPNKISFAHGDLNGFYLNNKYQVFWDLKELIDMLLFTYDQKNAYDINGFVDKRIISTSRLWEHLDQEEKDNLEAIRYRELVEFFPLIDMSSVFDEIRMYAKKHEFILHNADDIMVIEDVYDHRDRYEMKNMCLEYHLMHIYKAISGLTRTESFRKPYADLFNIDDLKIGVLFKITTIIELSNKLKEPVVLRSGNRHCNLELMHGVDKTREEAITEELPGYGFYVEAKITCKQQIKLYLHQVIETENGKEKSTLPIADRSIEIGDMYDTICDVLWSASQEHSSSDCASSISPYSHYCNFKSKLPALLKEMFQSDISKEEDIRDLQNIHIGGTQCSCCVQISHKMVLDMGVKHYLNSIARSIIACVKSPATFGKYKAQTIIITGSLLSEWTKLNNTLYRDFIWKQLEEELCLSLYQHQIKVHLIMSHTDVELFPDERLIKWEKYQQVVGERRFLVDIEGFNVSGELYEDKVDRYELVPSIKVDGKEHWRMHLIQNDDTLLGQSGISSRYYLNPSREYSSDFPYKIKMLFRISVYVCSSQNEQDLLDPYITLKDEAFVIHSFLSRSYFDSHPRPTIKGTDFPIVFTLEPENHHMKTRFSLECSCFGVDTALFSERITLKEIPS